MSQKEQIISLLKEHGVLKQLELSEFMYGDEKHGPNIYGALTSLYNELLCQHKKIHRFKVYKLYSLFVFQFIALEGVIHFIRYTVI